MTGGMERNFMPGSGTGRAVSELPGVVVTGASWRGVVVLRYRDDEAAALRAAAGRMKARTERAERAAGRAMTGSGGEEERNALLDRKSVV